MALRNWFVRALVQTPSVDRSKTMNTKPPPMRHCAHANLPGSSPTEDCTQASQADHAQGEEINRASPELRTER